MASLAKKLLGGFATAALIATPTAACAEENTAGTTTEGTAPANQNRTSAQSQCITYNRIDSNLTIVGSGTRFKDDGNTSVQVAINPQRDLYIFENSSENPTEGCYKAQLRGTNFKGNDYMSAQPTSTDVSFSEEEAMTQCRELGFEEGTCVPSQNLARSDNQLFRTAFTATFNGDNLITFLASRENDGGWNLYRTFNRGATVIAMGGTDFEWTPEVKQFYEQRRLSVR